MKTVRIVKPEGLEGVRRARVRGCSGSPAWDRRRARYGHLATRSCWHAPLASPRPSWPGRWRRIEPGTIVGRGFRPTRGRASWSRSAMAPPAYRSVTRSTPHRRVSRRVDRRVRVGREYLIIEARSLAPKPTTVDFIEAAAIPGLTSWQALFDHGHLESGQTVVIHGAGEGVGSVGVQLASLWSWLANLTHGIGDRAYDPI